MYRQCSMFPLLHQVCLKSKAGTQEEDTAAGSGSGMAAGKSADDQKGNKGSADSQRETQTQHQMAGNRMQTYSSTVYHTVPTNMNYLQCPDVGYLSNIESWPVHSQPAHTAAANDKCLMCWGNEHGINNCPKRSQELKEETKANFFPLKRLCPH